MKQELKYFNKIGNYILPILFLKFVTENIFKLYDNEQCVYIYLYIYSFIYVYIYVLCHALKK